MSKMLRVGSALLLFIITQSGTDAQSSIAGTASNVCRTLANTADTCSCQCRPQPSTILVIPEPFSGYPGFGSGNGGSGNAGYPDPGYGSGGNPYGSGPGGNGGGSGSGGYPYGNGGNVGVSPQAAYQSAPGSQNPTVVQLPPPPSVLIQQQPSKVSVQSGGTNLIGSGFGSVLGGVQCAPDDLVCLVFTGDGDSSVTHCPYNTTNTWYYRDWKIGAIRPYYLNQGPVRDIYECKDFCDKLDDCYFATVTGAKICYLLTTTDASACPIAKSGHYDKELVQCTNASPCPSAYKRCSRPYCTLESIRRKYCLTGDKQDAVTHCVPQ